jgi:hypothetical protein
MRAPPSCDSQRTKLNNPASFLSIDARMDQFKQVGVQPLAAQTLREMVCHLLNWFRQTNDEWGEL